MERPELCEGGSVKPLRATGDRTDQLQLHFWPDSRDRQATRCQAVNLADRLRIFGMA
jgi:hypothetical protein